VDTVALTKQVLVSDVRQFFAAVGEARGHMLNASPLQNRLVKSGQSVLRWYNQRMDNLHALPKSLLPELRRAAHGRECAALGGGGVRPTPGAAMVLSFPYPLRFLFASMPDAIGPVLAIVHRLIAGWLSDQADIERTRAQRGAVTLIQRFGSALNLNIHFPHAVARRRVRNKRRATAAQATPAPRPRTHVRAAHGTGRQVREPRMPAPGAQGLARRRGRIPFHVGQR